MHKILIVDDERPARNFIAELVVSYIPNAKVTQTGNPQKALAYLQNEEYDMLFLDIRMPGMSGLELLEQIKRSGKDPYTVIISAHCEFDYAVKGIELGVVKYITKPLYKEKISEAIQTYLQKLKPNTLKFKAPDGIKHITIAHIIALEVVAKGKIRIYSSNEIIPCATGRLMHVRKFLPSHFLHIRRDCIVNRHAIKRINPKTNEVTVNFKDQELVFKVSRERMRVVSSE
jgi:YesN/AraC family two-component response regulator